MVLGLASKREANACQQTSGVDLRDIRAVQSSGPDNLMWLLKETKKHKA